MNASYTLLFLMVVATASAARKPDDAARDFLMYQYGKSVPDISEICLPSEDIWMLQGKVQPEQQRLVGSLKISVRATGLFMDSVDRDICIVEMKDGKVDPSFNLEGVYGIHRRLVVQFFYFSLLQDRKELVRLVTDIKNVSFGKVKKAAYGDMDVYSGILGFLPVVRSSAPRSDAASKSVNYRMPLGEEIFEVRVIKRDGAWRIDTSKSVIVPLQYFWR
jgi:hypothetical protein